jgi:hypothetical protein
MMGSSPLLTSSQNTWFSECEAAEEEENRATEASQVAPVMPFTEVTHVDAVYKPQPNIPGLVFPYIERRRSSKKKISTATILGATFMNCVSN